MELTIVVTDDQALALQYLCDEYNKTHSIPVSGPKTIQNLFDEQCNYYIKRMLQAVVPVHITEDILAGLTDAEQAELQARTINHYNDFVKTNLAEMTAIPDAEKTQFRKLMDWILNK